MLKKLLFVLGGLSILLTGIVYAAPSYRVERTILPETTSLYDLGSSLRTWATGYFDQLCLNGTCKTSWPAGGGGSGGGTWATTTSNVSGELINYPLNDTDIITIGSSATTSSEYWFDPNTFISYLKGKVGISTTSPYAALSVVGATGVVADHYTATGTVTSVFPLANITKLSNLTSNGLVTTSGGDGSLSITAILPIANGGTNNNAAIGASSTAVLSDGSKYVYYKLAPSNFTTANISQWTNDSGYLTAVTADSPLSGSGTSGSHLTLSTAGTWSGNAGTATALAANGTNCSAGNYPLGVDASGNVENCTAAGGSGTVSSGIAGQIGWYSSSGTTISGTSTWPLTVGSIISTTTATSTFAGGIKTTALDVTSTSATSTFANGIQFTGGTIKLDKFPGCNGNSVLETDANGVISCGADAGAGAGVSGSGVTNAFAFWSDASTLGASTSPTVGYLTATTTFGLATSTLIGDVRFGSSTRDNLFQVTANRDYPSSSSVGGMVNFTNTNNSGSAFVIYGNHGSGATAPQYENRCDNAAFDFPCERIDYDGTNDALVIAATAASSNAISASNSGVDHTITASYTGSTANKGALNLTSTNTAGSVFQIAGNTAGLGVGKITHNSTGDANSSILSLDASSAGYLGQGLFLDCTGGSCDATNKALQIADNLGTNGSALTLLWGGNLGLGTTSPYAKLSVVGPVVARNFIGTSTDISSFGGAVNFASDLNIVGNSVYGTTNFVSVGNNDTANQLFIGGTSFDAVLDLTKLTASRNYRFPDWSGIIAVSTSTLDAPAFIATSTASSTLPRISATGISSSWLCLDSCRTTWPTGSGSSSSGPINTLQASDGSGGFIGTGTPQLTIGYLTATSTAATSTFAGGFNVGNGSIMYDYSGKQITIKPPQSLGNGVPLIITGQQGNGGGYSGGDVQITGGDGNSGAQGGNIVINGGNTTISPNPGNIILGGTRGNVGVASSTPTGARLAVNSMAGDPFSLWVGSTTAPWLKTSNTGFGTTTLSGLTVSGSATSTSNVGFNLSGGCFAINGTCISGGGGSGTINSGTTNRLSYYSGATTLDSSFIALNNSANWLGIGTTTPQWLATFSTSTAPQIGITTGAGIGGWAIRNDNAAHLTISTTSPTTFATSTNPLFELRGEAGTVSSFTMATSSTASATSTIIMGKLQFDGYDNAGVRRCVYLVGAAWVFGTGPCNQ